MDSESPNANRTTCPHCAEEVKPAAIVCPHCRGRLDNAAPLNLHRNRAGRQLAGVAIALAEYFGISVTFVRLAFIVLTFLNFAGAFAYVVLWVVLPAEAKGSSPLVRAFSSLGGEARADGRSIFEHWLERLRSFFRSLRRPAETKGSSEATAGVEPSGQAVEPANHTS